MILKHNLGFLALFLLSCLLLVTLLGPDEAEAAPGRRKSGGSSGGGWFGSKKKNNNNWGSNTNYNNRGNSGWGGGSNYKKKGGTMKTLKKAAVIGAVAYGGYQLGKLSAGYGSWGWGRQHGYGFNDWNSWREVDGFMCRNSNDCNWIDPRLYCQDYELNFTPMQGWFGGDYMSIVGECSCPRGMYWYDREMQCRDQGIFGTLGTIVGTVLTVVAILACCCCCGCAIFLYRRFFSD